MLNHFDTLSRSERAEVAENLKRLYNRWYEEENTTFLAMRAAGKGAAYTEAQKKYIAAVSKLGAIQAVFVELGIEFDGPFAMGA
jgi:hypothetical protein